VVTSGLQEGYPNTLVTAYHTTTENHTINNDLQSQQLRQLLRKTGSEGTEMTSGFSKVNHQTQEWYASDLKILGDRRVT
jgi:hypothetical protein